MARSTETDSHAVAGFVEGGHPAQVSDLGYKKRLSSNRSAKADCVCGIPEG